MIGEITTLLDKSIEGVEMSQKPPPVMDLSKIDFRALAARFKETKRKNIELEALKAAVRAMLERLIRLNRTRVDFQEEFEALIEAYNSGSKNIEELFRELLKLSRSLTEEEARHVREHLSEEELTVFDILTRPAPEMNAAEREEVKRVASLLLQKLKTVLTFNWRQTTQARARVRLAIEETLDSGLPRVYSPPLYQEKCARLFEHVYETYRGDGETVFASTILRSERRVPSYGWQAILGLAVQSPEVDAPRIITRATQPHFRLMTVPLADRAWFGRGPP